MSQTILSENKMDQKYSSDLEYAKQPAVAKEVAD